MKTPNKTELQRIASNNSSDIDFDDFKRLSRDYTAEPYSFSVTDTTLPSDNYYIFGKIYWEKYRE